MLIALKYYNTLAYYLKYYCIILEILLLTHGCGMIEKYGKNT